MYLALADFTDVIKSRFTGKSKILPTPHNASFGKQKAIIVSFKNEPWQPTENLLIEKPLSSVLLP